VTAFSNSANCTRARIEPAELITRPSCPSPKKSPSDDALLEAELQEPVEIARARLPPRELHAAEEALRVGLREAHLQHTGEPDRRAPGTRPERRACSRWSAKATGVTGGYTGGTYGGGWYGGGTGIGTGGGIPCDGGMDEDSDASLTDGQTGRRTRAGTPASRRGGCARSGRPAPR
jgi:hypothetical protein